MRARRLSIIMTAAGVLALGSALPAAAHTDHGSCQGFGGYVNGWARGGYAEYGLTNPGFGPFATGPGAIAANVDHEHELFCQP